jgi:hypothetical protein
MKLPPSFSIEGGGAGDTGQRKGVGYSRDDYVHGIRKIK